jgi:hypothetical protein
MLELSYYIMPRSQQSIEKHGEPNQERETIGSFSYFFFWKAAPKKKYHELPPFLTLLRVSPFVNDTVNQVFLIQGMVAT